MARTKRTKSKDKYKEIVKSLYDGFSKIAEKKISELTSKKITDSADKLSIESITNTSRGEKEVKGLSPKKAPKTNIKNFFKNIEKKGVRSDKAFTVSDVLIDPIFKGTNTKIVVDSENNVINTFDKRKKVRKKIKLSKKAKTKRITQK